MNYSSYKIDFTIGLFSMFWFDKPKLTLETILWLIPCSFGLIAYYLTLCCVINLFSFLTWDALNFQRLVLKAAVDFCQKFEVDVAEALGIHCTVTSSI